MCNWDSDLVYSLCSCVNKQSLSKKNHMKWNILYKADAVRFFRIHMNEVIIKVIANYKHITFMTFNMY